MNCNYCKNCCIKKGKRNGIQKYYCSNCKKHQQCFYTHKRCSAEQEQLIIKMNNRSSGISDIAFVLGISKATVVRKIKKQSSKIQQPLIVEKKQCYEIDEMRVIVRKKENEKPLYLIYAINRKTKQLINFYIGRRTTENIQKVVNTVLKLNPSKIYTDGLNIYSSLIPKSIHSTSFYQTNYIEQQNLTLRTHLKRMATSTICFSKTIQMLKASIKLYFGQYCV